MGDNHKAEPLGNIENCLRRSRLAKGLTQGTLANLAGITRQAVYAIEANQYLPTTAVALRLAHVLECRVEDLFNLVSAGETVEGEWVGHMPRDRSSSAPVRVKVARVGGRLLVRPVAGLGGVLNFTVPADGLVRPQLAAAKSKGSKGHRVQVSLLRDRRAVEGEVVVAGCDPSIFLVGEYLRRQGEQASVVGWTMGSVAALEALKRGEVHVAGLHLVDQKSGESNVPYLRRHLTGQRVRVVTYASWEQGLVVRRGNPKGIRQVADVARKDVIVINREGGAGARLLLDAQLAFFGIRPQRVRGYGQTAASHLEVARLVAEGRADVGLGVQSAARLLGLDFIPLQQERYDLVIPEALFGAHASLKMFLDTLVSRVLRAEIDALGGYDTSETGKVVEWAQ